MIRWVIATFASAAISTTPLAVAARQTPPTIQKIRAFSPEKTQALGAAMYTQDQAAWRASDLLMAAKLDTTGMFGWIATPYAGGQRVRFLKGQPKDAEAAYEVVFQNNLKPVLQPTKDATLTADEAAQLRALDTALAASHSRCGSRPPNHIELRDPDSGEWLVWLLTPWTDQGIPMGGHTRFTISSDGSTLIRKEAMSTGCLNMKPMTGAQTPMMVVTQLVADMPLETHVFNSLQAKVPIAVAMSDKSFWLVDGRQISNMGNLNELQRGKPPAQR